MTDIPNTPEVIERRRELGAIIRGRGDVPTKDIPAEIEKALRYEFLGELPEDDNGDE